MTIAETIAEPRKDPTPNPHGELPGECDLVMKGGIASAVVYPRVVSELAKRYARFRCIGGTSAGAIAAGLTAAAEHGRRTGANPRSFDAMGALPDWLAARRRVLKMFRPEPYARSIFTVLISATKGTGPVDVSLRLVGEALLTQKLAALAGAIPGAILALAIAARGLEPSGPVLFFQIGAVLLAGLFVVAGAVAAAVFALLRALLTDLPAHFFGLSTGFDPAKPGAGAEAPLTNWLTQEINELAGKPPGEPLTFGDLWLAGGTLETQGDRDAALARCLTSVGDRAIHLEVITTCLSHGRPYSLPFNDNVDDYFRDDAAWRVASPTRAKPVVEPARFYFDPAEWRRLFPEEVVAWMERTARSSSLADAANTKVETLDGRVLMRLPRTVDFPVVAAVRMSLSFPLLLSAIPLYAVDYAREENDRSRRDGRPRLAERCWFSDGGICSNFPIHLFDAPLTTRPTFGVNLEEFPVDLQKLFSDPDWPNDPEIRKQAVRGPHSNAERTFVGESWNRFDSESGSKRFSGFLMSIFGAAQNWQDNALTRLPGYRDRIVGIRQGAGEGGMNLDMDAATIRRLGDRGAEAGSELAGLQADWWTDHRWVRYRSIMGLLETFFDDIERGLQDTRGGAVPESESEGLLLDALQRKPGVIPPKAYTNITEAERVYAVKVTRQLRTLCQEWKAAQGEGLPINLGHDAPRPRPILHVGPDW